MLTYGVTIFDTKKEDFFKIYFPTILVFFLVLYTMATQPTHSILTNKLFIFFIIFVIDFGHLYTTFIESLLDKSEWQKTKIWYWIIFAITLNYSVLKFYPHLFFYYIFYFALFHNMRQGLGITFLSTRNLVFKIQTIKWLYYSLTVFPFLLYALKDRKEIIQNHLSVFKNLDIQLIFNVGSIAYFIIFLMTLVLFIYKKIDYVLTFFFFASIYAFSFLISEKIDYSRPLLMISHGIPYIFLMEKRIKHTHPSAFIKKYSYGFIFMFILIGTLLMTANFKYQDVMTKYPILTALLFTPSIVHYIVDAIIWKRGHEKFDTFRALKT